MSRSLSNPFGPRTQVVFCENYYLVYSVRKKCVKLIKDVSLMWCSVNFLAQLTCVH